MPHTLRLDVHQSDSKHLLIKKIQGIEGLVLSTAATLSSTARCVSNASISRIPSLDRMPFAVQEHETPAPTHAAFLSAREDMLAADHAAQLVFKFHGDFLQ